MEKEILEVEQRLIGGSRVLLIKRYNGQEKKMDDTQKCFLERRISATQETGDDQQEIQENDDRIEIQETNTSKEKIYQNKDYQRIMGGVVGVAGLALGAWIYTKTIGEHN